MNKFTEIMIKSAKLGERNPLPDIKNTATVHAEFIIGNGLDKDDTEHLGKGLVDTVLPYLIQDGYDRNKQETLQKAVILENDKLKAIFLPEFGARLYSLFDKVHGKDLLYTNTVLQPSNFAIRNAWFSGGVEFNIGLRGHCTLTCEPMFTEFIGDDAVRFYEYERLRGLAYSITAYLPEGSETLYLKMRIENTTDDEIYMYWWSNIAFPEKSETRVIVPTDTATVCYYQNGKDLIERVNIPIINGTDTSYPTNLKSAKDYFYKIPKDKRKWIVAVDPDGTGLLQYSNAFLKGRKLFLWGNNKGGRRWNEFLSEKGQAYIEIQAGILNTQLEHIPMPAHTVWEWTEGYTYIDGSNKEFYGDWDNAIKEVEKIFEQKISDKISIAPEEFDDLKISGEIKTVMNASGWGGLENKARKLAEKLPISDSLKFDYIESEETEDFNCLLDKGYLPYHDTSYVPKAYINGKFWYDVISWSLKEEKGNHWYAYLQLGVTAYAEGLIKEAEQAFIKSIEKTPSLWAYRNLAALYFNEYKQKDEGFDYFEKALEMNNSKQVVSFLKEVGKIYSTNGKDARWIEIYQSLDQEIKNSGRLKMYYSLALLHVGEYDKAKEVLEGDFVVSDYQEGEDVITQLWKNIHAKICERDFGISEDEARKLAEEKYPIPYELDFRMYE